MGPNRIEHYTLDINLLKPLHLHLLSHGLEYSPKIYVADQIIIKTKGKGSNHNFLKLGD